MYVNHLTINYKSSLVCQIVCMGVVNFRLAGLPQAGWLYYHPTSWLIVTQDHWILNTVLGYLIDLSSESHQQSAPNSPQNKPV